MISFQDPTVQRALLLRARQLVEGAARGLPPSGTLAPEIAAIPCFGLFVTLRRTDKLRGCIGNYRVDQTNPVGLLLDQAAPAAALKDPRFPPVGSAETGLLTIELTPLHSFRPVEATGRDRVRAIVIGRHGVIVRADGKRGLFLPQVATENRWDVTTFLEKVCQKAGLPTDAWTWDHAELITFEGEPFAEELSPNESALATVRGEKTATRPAAKAGQFYPATAAGIKVELDRCYAPTKLFSPDPARAVMLPHAGWRFCGDLIAVTLARVQVPEVAVILGPKHTAAGPEWSVSAAGTWEWPGGKLEVAGEWAAFLVSRCPRLIRENEAHREEHGCEVLLPFLHRRNPFVRILPIAIGRADFEELASLSEALAALREELGERVLFIVSSDMNHFAEEVENRRLDALALDPLEAGDPRGLYETCLNHRISMCGMRPAVAVLRALAMERHPSVEITGYETSARITGDTSRVVGYAGAVME
ncbi:MAG: AmmeMemoRadiSam system protein B [Verrucomicrobiales bacterium]|nr:AmmeMemoRadiSam system protein B [Verrucomicrobiales bacterium]